MLAQIENKDNQQVSMWSDESSLKEIKAIYGKSLTDAEFKIFVGVGVATRLNPFLKEIWAVKYGDNPAQIFIGRDGYRKAAQSYSEYDYHQCDAVYENDRFEVINGEVVHSYTLKDRGRLSGAYCITKRHKSTKPIYVYVDIKEYSTGKSLWNSKPATMIKKVAESQCLRACFQDLFGGTYAEEEQWQDEPSSQQQKTKSEQVMDRISSAKDSKPIVIDAKPSKSLELSEQQIEDIEGLLATKDFPNERLKKALGHYKVEWIYQLTPSQADEFISILNKLEDK